jgi:hypothetical protein
LHCPFGHLKHKLWPKEMSRVKLVIWLPTTKSQESTQFCRVQVACDILLKRSQQGLQLCFIPHRNLRFARQVMHLQSRGSPNYGNFRTPTWDSWDKKSFGCGPPLRAAKYTIRGKVVASPKSKPWWIFCVQVAHGSS